MSAATLVVELLTEELPPRTLPRRTGTRRVVRREQAQRDCDVMLIEPLCDLGEVFV